MGYSYLFLNFLGTGEFVLIAFVFLLLFGPDKIPNLARNLGIGIRKIKDTTEEIKKEINASSDGISSVSSDIKKDLKEVDEITKSMKRQANKNLNE
tara:strand:+ start:825 stop:1112 length:288 start_codon:yes stop_codon:yes gene_type:complete